jgi:phosphatidylglycerophosphate synthase
MKDALTDMMLAMMPAMMPMVWIGAIMMAIGLVALILRIAAGSSGLSKTTLKWTGGILLALGGFFVAAQFMGQWLGMQPQINFGDPTKFEFKLIMFWQLGIAGLITGIVYLLAGKNP